MAVFIKELPEYEVAFIRRIGSYFEPNDSWEKIMEWAMENKLFPPEHYFIGISLDNPKMVEQHACRYDACVTIPEGFAKESHSNVQFKKLSGGLYALYPFYDMGYKLAEAYQNIFQQWLPNSEYDADDRDCLEFCMNNPAEDPEGKCKVDLYIPIRKKI
ncbi:AraC family transcriptional regulator [Aneurinibacillus sp. REN35]|uniref:AraC family transcriptional regulator n=1 Tax=Aneurinibacillus sp. REN35 TaxID=3237286 RepID=UPI003527D778